MGGVTHTRALGEDAQPVVSFKERHLQRRLWELENVRAERARVLGLIPLAKKGTQEHRDLEAQLRGYTHRQLRLELEIGT